MPAGSFYAYWLFEVAEAIDLAILRGRLGAAGATRSPQFRVASPEYVRFAQPPVITAAGSVRTPSGAEFQASFKYFDYGVLSVELACAFDLPWPELVDFSAKWLSSAELEKSARDLAKGGAEQAGPSMLKPAAVWMAEDYYVIHVRDTQGSPPLDALAQIVRGEALPLSASEQAEILRSVMSYYPTDLLVVGWMAAVVCDNDEGAAATRELLEYVNTQLLEFRFYDEFLTVLLTDAYKKAEARNTVFSRWRMAREAQHLNTVRLDVVELSERTDNALKFLGDMYYARLYRLAAERVGVNDYRRLVDEKLATARELYEFFNNEVHHFRAYILELAVVIILIIDLYFILKEAKVF